MCGIKASEAQWRGSTLRVCQALLKSAVLLSEIAKRLTFIFGNCRNILHYIFKIFTDIAYVLITGIDYENQRMEILYQNGTTKVCHSYDSRYPIEIRTATSAFSNNRLIICGGGYPVTSVCYALEKTFKWTILTHMTTPRLA